MKTITSPPPPALLLALLMSKPPGRPQPPSLPPSPTPPFSLPESPTCLEPVLPDTSALSASLATALLNQFTHDFCDDGLDLVQDILSNEKPANASLPPPDVGRLLAGWKAADWGHSKTNARASNSTSVNSSQIETSLQTPDDVTSEQSLHEDDDKEDKWLYSEDCVVADVFTRVLPEKQRGEVRRRLPGRTWSDAHSRFRSVCEKVYDNSCDQSRNDREGKSERSFWRRRRNSKLKPQCFISKTLSKFR